MNNTSSQKSHYLSLLKDNHAFNAECLLNSLFYLQVQFVWLSSAYVAVYTGGEYSTLLHRWHIVDTLSTIFTSWICNEMGKINQGKKILLIWGFSLLSSAAAITH